MADNTLTIKFDKETTLPLLEGLGKSAYTIAVAHGFQGTEQEWLKSLQGKNGASAYEIAKQNGFQGTEQDWLKSLVGPAGKIDGDYQLLESAQLLRQKNIYLPNSNIETVIAKVIEVLGDKIKYTPKQLEYEQPNAGQTYIDLKGEPHFKVSINNGEKKEFESDNMRVNIEPFGAIDINITYYDLNDQEYSHLIIRKTAPSTDDVYTASNGVVYTRYGKELEINVSEYDGTTPFKFVPKWGNAGLTKVSIKSDKKVMLLLNRDSIVDDTGNERIISTGVVVIDYHKVSFKLTEQIYAFLLITGEGFSQTSCALNNIDRTYIVWNDATKQYTSSAMESV